MSSSSRRVAARAALAGALVLGPAALLAAPSVAAPATPVTHTDWDDHHGWDHDHDRGWHHDHDRDWDHHRGGFPFNGGPDPFGDQPGPMPGGPFNGGVLFPEGLHTGSS